MTKKGRKMLKIGSKIGIFWYFGGGFLAVGTWVSIFFGIMTWQKHWNNHWNEKKKTFEIFAKIPIFLINLSKKLTLCCKWL